MFIELNPPLSRRIGFRTRSIALAAETEVLTHVSEIADESDSKVWLLKSWIMRGGRYVDGVLRLEALNKSLRIHTSTDTALKLALHFRSTEDSDNLSAFVHKITPVASSEFDSKKRDYLRKHPVITDTELGELRFKKDDPPYFFGKAQWGAELVDIQVLANGFDICAECLRAAKAMLSSEGLRHSWEKYAAKQAHAEAKIFDPDNSEELSYYVEQTLPLGVSFMRKNCVAAMFSAWAIDHDLHGLMVEGSLRDGPIRSHLI